MIFPILSCMFYPIMYVLTLALKCYWILIMMRFGASYSRPKLAESPTPKARPGKKRESGILLMNMLLRIIPGTAISRRQNQWNRVYTVVTRLETYDFGSFLVARSTQPVLRSDFFSGLRPAESLGRVFC